MEKPTSNLNFEIIQFVMRQSQVTELLIGRDRHPDAAGVELVCKFYKRNPTHSRLSAYTVDFIYNTRYPAREKDDDISVLVEVMEGNPPSFQIIDIRKY